MACQVVVLSAVGGGAVGAVWCDPLYHSTKAHSPTPNILQPNTLPTAPNTTAAYTTTLYTAAPHTTGQQTIYPPPTTPHTPA